MTSRGCCRRSRTTFIAPRRLITIRSDSGADSAGVRRLGDGGGEDSSDDLDQG
jgi:hypothetical protein